MIITKKHLSRRTFIRGTFGAAMALPLLDAMVPALTAQAHTAAGTANPFRFLVGQPNVLFPMCLRLRKTGDPHHGSFDPRDPAWAGTASTCQPRQ